MAFLDGALSNDDLNRFIPVIFGIEKPIDDRADIIDFNTPLPTGTEDRSDGGDPASTLLEILTSQL